MVGYSLFGKFRTGIKNRGCLLAVYVFVQDYKLLGRAYLGETTLSNSETNKDNHQICFHI